MSNLSIQLEAIKDWILEIVGDAALFKFQWHTGKHWWISCFGPR